MNLTARIKANYGTVKRFAQMSGLNLKSVYMTLSGYPRQVVVDALIEQGYIQSADDLRKVA